MTNNFPVLDKGILGVKDDGSPEGILKVKIEQGELVKIPINSFIQGTETQILGSVTTSNISFNNGDGSGSGLNFNIATAGLGSNYALMTTIVYGKIIGIRFRRFVNTPSFSVVIDGVPYDCPTYRQKPYSSNTVNISSDRENTWIVADDLPDGQHTVQIFLYPDALVSKTLVIHGFTLEKRVGYKEYEKNDFIYSTGTCTTSSVNIPSTDFNGQNIKNIKQISYQNTDAVARIVTLNYNNIAIAKIYLSASGTIGDTAKYDFGSGVGLGGTINGLSHLADVAGKINFITIGKS